MTRFGPRLLLCCLVLPLLPEAVLAAGTGPPQPAYARLALPPDGAQVILVKFRSEGAFRARNVVVVDTNLDGTLEPGEKLVGKAPGRQPKGYQFYTFSPLKFAGTCGGAPITWSINLTSYAFSTGDRWTGYQSAYLSGQLDQGEDRWLYMGSVDLKTSASQASAPLCGASGTPTFTLKTKPDQEEKGQTGIGASFGWAGLSSMFLRRGSAASSRGAPQRAAVRLTVTDEAGKTAHQAEVILDDMGFG